jgi:NAD(P)-dependent dehydrogenase (short-subunit alcohol dehydrogenase family)
MGDTLARFDMSGRRAIVTGAAGLLGREFCGALLDVGAEVFALDLAGPALDGVAATAGITAVVCDVTDPEAVAGSVASVAAAGDIDALVTSAAVDPKVDGAGGISGSSSGFPGYPAALWQQSMLVNLTGTFLVAQAVAGVMERQADGRGRGSIVTIASTYGLTGPDQRLYVDDAGVQQAVKPLDYPTTKAGVIGFTRALAAYYRQTGIRVNSLTPGGAFNGQDPGFVARYSERTIMGRMAEPCEYRAAIAFLCSDASSYMTGANLVVDGGWTAL